MSQGTGNSPPSALLAVTCAAWECDGDDAGQRMSVIFLPPSSSRIAKASSPIIKTVARVAACPKGNHLPNSPQIYTTRTPFYCGEVAERAGQSAP